MTTCSSCYAEAAQQCVECGESLCDDCIEAGCCSITPANVEDIDEEPGEPDYNAVSW